jgi:hypothetical protein
MHRARDAGCHEVRQRGQRDKPVDRSSRADGGDHRPDYEEQPDQESGVMADDDRGDQAKQGKAKQDQSGPASRPAGDPAQWRACQQAGAPGGLDRSLTAVVDHRGGILPVTRTLRPVIAAPVVGHLPPVALGLVTVVGVTAGRARSALRTVTTVLVAAPPVVWPAGRRIAEARVAPGGRKGRLGPTAGAAGAVRPARAGLTVAQPVIINVTVSIAGAASRAAVGGAGLPSTGIGVVPAAATRSAALFRPGRIVSRAWLRLAAARSEPGPRLRPRWSAHCPPTLMHVVDRLPLPSLSFRSKCCKDVVYVRVVPRRH